MNTLQKNIVTSILLCVILATGSLTSCTNKTGGEDTIMGLLLGVAYIMGKPVLMRATTYDLDDTVIGISEQKLFAAKLSTSQPDMRNMHELYAGVEIKINLLDESIVKQTPLLAQFWAIEGMTSSVDTGPDGLWMTEDDTIDPILGYHETVYDGEIYRLTAYKDFGVTPKEVVDYTVEGDRKVATTSYSAGPDEIIGTYDDVPERVARFFYNNKGKMERAECYSGDGATFECVYHFEYDDKGRLLSMKPYKDQAMEERLNFGSCSKLTWDDSGEHTTLTVKLGYQSNLFGYWINLYIQTFDFEFNEEGRISKRIMYKPLSTTQIDVCNIYNYSGGGMLDRGNMNDTSDNYSDDGETQVSYTINEISLGVE
ncbi:MAG: hypothetical protein JW838_00980 [Spirochaetes bacterium]|nr:hypothetical protein [Spirochaetota bacterium]